MSSILHDEIIIEILKKASLKSLHRLKQVSKSWFSIINNEVLPPQVGTYPNPCIYYKYHNGDGARPLTLSLANPNKDHIIRDSFDFLPDNKNIYIVDSCNGLILCCNRTNDSCFVCNPVDKTYNEISVTRPDSPFCLLDFNPLKSPHYNLVVVQWLGISKELEFDVYHSNRQRFQKVLVHVQHLEDIEWKRSSIALWNGYVYFECGVAADSSEGSSGWADKQSELKVLKISGVLQRGENIGYGVVEFPGGVMYSRKGELCGYMGTWKEKLRFVSISAQGIKAWALRDDHEDEWRLEHDRATTFLGLSEHFWLNSDEPRIVGFHPIRNVILILFKRLVYAYDFDRSSFEIFWEFENDWVLPCSVFSFSPCFANQVLA